MSAPYLSVDLNFKIRSHQRAFLLYGPSVSQMTWKMPLGQYLWSKGNVKGYVILLTDDAHDDGGLPGGDLLEHGEDLVDDQPLV